jgi:GNAT superfamily N-acetyltransferase
MAPVALQLAKEREAGAIAELLSAAADTLTMQYGTGHWSKHSSDRGVRWLMRIGKVYVVRESDRIVATLTLTPRKPWAIEIDHFTNVTKAVYMLSMAVAPDRQGNGVGRACVELAVELCRKWPANALRLDAYDAIAGAGGFYEKCGFRSVGRIAYRNVPLIYFERMV